MLNANQGTETLLRQKSYANSRNRSRTKIQKHSEETSLSPWAWSEGPRRRKKAIKKDERYETFPPFPPLPFFLSHILQSPRKAPFLLPRLACLGWRKGPITFAPSSDGSQFSTLSPRFLQLDLARAGESLGAPTHMGRDITFFPSLSLPSQKLPGKQVEFCLNFPSFSIFPPGHPGESADHIFHKSSFSLFLRLPFSLRPFSSRERYVGFSDLCDLAANTRTQRHICGKYKNTMLAHGEKGGKEPLEQRSWSSEHSFFLLFRVECPTLFPFLDPSRRDE